MALVNLQQTVTYGNPYDVCTTERKNQVGARMATADGRVWRYAKAGGAITAGDVVAMVPDTFAIPATYFGADTSTAPAAGLGGAIGDTKIQHCVVTGSRTALVNEYANGYLVITDGAGEGYCYGILSNEPNGASGNVTLVIDHGLVVALTNASVAMLVKNPWMDLVVMTYLNATGNPAEVVAGVAPVACDSGSYIWVQTWGVAAVQAGAGTMLAGSVVINAEDVSGSAQIPVATEVIIDFFGVAMADTADTIFGPVFLKVCP